MKNIVGEIIAAKGTRYFDKAWSPVLGDVNIDKSYRIGDTYRIHISSKRNRNATIILDGEGRYYEGEGGEIMLFPEKGKNWDEISFDKSNVKPLDYYITDSIKEQVIEDAIDCLDFDKIHSVMEFLDWHWATVLGVPTVSQLKMAVRNYLEDLLSQVGETSYSIATGGFEYSFKVYEPNEGEADTFDNCVNVSVKFVLDDFDSLI